MKFDNHIAKRLLTDSNLWLEMIESQAQSEGVNTKEWYEKSDGLPASIENYASMYQMLDNKENKTYYVTKSVTDRLSMFDTKNAMKIEGWKVFKHLGDFKKTYILPEGNTCIRVMKRAGVLYFCHLDLSHQPKEQRRAGTEEAIYWDDEIMYWILVSVDLDKNELCQHIHSEDGKRITPFLYTLMCFTLLCDNQTVLVEPKQKYGTQKSGKVINTLPFPITIINNTWNVTTVRASEIFVRGHAAIRWTGSGRGIPRVVLIEPFTKEGYTRRSGKELEAKTTTNG